MPKLKLLAGCEISGKVRDAFKKQGWDAWSCDLLPNSGQHLRMNVMSALSAMRWDMIILFPPCTHLAVSGNRWWAESKERKRAISWTTELYHRSIVTCSMVAMENPVGALSEWNKPTQYIQPYEFGHDASKKTGLWLCGLPPLIPTKYIEPRIVTIKGKKYKRWGNQTDSGQNRLGPSETRAAERGETYQGIADAMASQWGNL